MLPPSPPPLVVLVEVAAICEPVVVELCVPLWPEVWPLLPAVSPTVTSLPQASAAVPNMNAAARVSRFVVSRAMGRADDSS